MDKVLITSYHYFAEFFGGNFGKKKHIVMDEFHFPPMEVVQVNLIWFAPTKGGSVAPLFLAILDVPMVH